MRLAVTADLHLPITPFARISALCREIAEFHPDAIAIAGDVAESLADWESCLELFRKVGCPVLVLAGNHDLWCREVPSRSLWEKVLPELVRRCNCVWLEEEPFTQGGIAIAGTVAWYDYSAADPGVVASIETFAHEKRHYNNDAFLINWPWSDIEFAQRVAEPFLATLDRLQSDEAVRQIVVVTHVPVLECQMTRRPSDRDWAFSNAYFGNLTLGAKILTHSKVTRIVSGHTHVGLSAKHLMPDGRVVEAHVLDSHYRRPAWLGLVVDGPAST